MYFFYTSLMALGVCRDMHNWLHASYAETWFHGASLKNPIFREGVQEKAIYTTKLPWKGKKHLKISFYTCAPKIMFTRCMVAEIWCTMDWLTDGRTDRGKKWHIEVGVPPKNTTERMFSFKYTKNELHHKYFPRFYIDSYLCFTICRNFNNTYFTELLATALT